MSGVRGNEFWTKYRRHLVRSLIVRGYAREDIAERLGVSRHSLELAIDRLRLADPELADADHG